MKCLGFIDENLELSPSDSRLPECKDIQYKEREVNAMEVYAAQIDRMDQGIGEIIYPLEGRSLQPYFIKDKNEREEPIFWEHGGNSAIRDGRYKLVMRRNHEWELYDILSDRIEIVNLALEMPDKEVELKAKYKSWAERIGVLQWPIKNIQE